MLDYTSDLLAGPIGRQVPPILLFLFLFLFLHLSQK
ncbi:unnamed protein product [Spirodela intermedia]|uniref:Uncharacterized protein n=1 Tax=Spirodela intermedia TaxID=51605 RepID=A0A7I8INA4_SPIIN|nr:unnamed protein product [Spirodela intermedia]CAA6659279.1 unnamed protein product [Spirodela intermedia]